MNVQPVNNNQNFKALRISPSLTKTLEEQTPEYLEKLEQIGMKLEPLKKFHLYFLEDLRPQIYAENLDKYGIRDFFQELKNNIEPSLGKPYVAEDAVTKIYPKFPEIFQRVFNTKAEQTYSEFRNLDTLEQAAMYCDILEKDAISKEKEEAFKQAEMLKEHAEKVKAQKEKNRFVKSIMERFGQKATSEPSKPKFNLYDRIIKFWLDL